MNRKLRKKWIPILVTGGILLVTALVLVFAGLNKSADNGETDAADNTGEINENKEPGFQEQDGKEDIADTGGNASESNNNKTGPTEDIKEPSVE